VYSEKTIGLLTFAAKTIGMTTEESIKLATQLEDKRIQAMVDADVETLKNLLADNLYYGHTGGYVDDKASFLEKISSGQYSYESIKTDISNVTAIGDNGLVLNGELTIEVISSGEKKVFFAIYLSVWLLQGENWQFQSLQAAFKK
jgi:hypothetical protein